MRSTQAHVSSMSGTKRPHEDEADYDELMEKLIVLTKKVKTLRAKAARPPPPTVYFSATPPPVAVPHATYAQPMPYPGHPAYAPAPAYAPVPAYAQPPPQAYTATRRSTGSSHDVYVGNVPPGTTTADIKDVLGEFGAVFNVRWPPYEDKHFCHVTFVDAVSAIAALENPWPVHVLGQQVTVKPSTTKAARVGHIWASGVASAVCLTVKNVCWKKSAAELAEWLGPGVCRVQLRPHRRGHTGFGTVGFDSYERAVGVLQHMQGAWFGSRILSFDWLT